MGRKNKKENSELIELKGTLADILQAVEDKKLTRDKLIVFVRGKVLGTP